MDKKSDSLQRIWTAQLPDDQIKFLHQAKSKLNQERNNLLFIRFEPRLWCVLGCGGLQLGLQACQHLIYLTHLIYLICLIYLVYLTYLIYLICLIYLMYFHATAPFFQRDLSPIKFGSELILLEFHVYLENSDMSAILDFRLLEVGGKRGRKEGEGRFSRWSARFSWDGCRLTQFFRL